MKRIFAVALLLVAGTSAIHADEKLGEKLVVKELQGGFAGFTGKQWTIEPSGKWEEATVFNRKVTVTGREHWKRKTSKLWPRR